MVQRYLHALQDVRQERHNFQAAYFPETGKTGRRPFFIAHPRPQLQLQFCKRIILFIRKTKCLQKF